MENNRRHDMTETEAKLDSGRLLLFYRNTMLTSVRGFHVIVQTDHGEILSTESVSTIETSDASIRMTSQFTWLPISLEWELVKSSENISLSIRMIINKPVSIKSVILRAFFISPYDLFFHPSRKSCFTSHDEGVIWCGVPAYLGVESSQGGLPPVRLSFHEAAQLMEARIVKNCSDVTTGLIEIVRFGSDRDCYELPPGTYTLFDGEFIHQGEFPLPFKYPKDLFVDGQVKTILIVSSTHKEHTLSQIQRIRSVFPGVMNGSRILPPTILVSWEFSDEPLGDGIRLVKLPYGAKEIRRIANEWYSRWQPDLVIRLQPDIRAPFGGRFNLLALLLKTKYKAKIDLAGESLFILNMLVPSLHRRIIGLWGKRRKFALKGVKIVLLLLWLIYAPVLYFREQRSLKEK